MEFCAVEPRVPNHEVVERWNVRWRLNLPETIVGKQRLYWAARSRQHIIGIAQHGKRRQKIRHAEKNVSPHTLEATS
jgi:hypothetical protein